MQMSDVIWKQNACCTTTAYATWICEEIIWIHSAVSEELRGNEILHRSCKRGRIWKQIVHVLVKVVVNHPKYLPESIEMIAPVIIELLAKYIKTIIAIFMQMS
jgi:hypothetical protein